MNHPVSDATIQEIAEAIFSEQPVKVFEAYSGFGQELREFSCAQDLFVYAQSQRRAPEMSVHIAVHYSDMAGRVVRKRVVLDPAKCQGHLHRYKIEGWGLIWVYLQLGPRGLDSFVSANSERRANSWAATFPELDAPSTWSWVAVGRHLRRLRRALKLAASRAQ